MEHSDDGHPYHGARHGATDQCVKPTITLRIYAHMFRKREDRSADANEAINAALKRKGWQSAGKTVRKFA